MSQNTYWITTARKRYSRRSFLSAMGFGAGYVGLSLAGCGGDRAGPKPAVSSAPKGPKFGGVLNWFDPGELVDLDPFEATARHAQRGVVGVVYDRLVEYDWSGGLTMADDKIIPRLAESWTIPDETTYVFKVRPGVKWHDGTEFTAADVKSSYDFILDPQNSLPGRSMLASVSKVEAPDKSTVKITLKAPSAAFLSMLTNDAVPIVPKHFLEKDRSGLAMKAVGTGPFVVEKLEPNVKVIFKKNPNYYVPGSPYLDGMVMSLITDWSAKAAAFMSKQIDLHIVSDKPQYDAIKAVIPDLQLRKWLGVNNTTFFFNFTRPPFNDLRMRRAFLLAVDHKGIIDRLWDGEGRINPPIISAGWEKWAVSQEELLKMPGFRQPKAQDIAEAKRLLAEAGYGSGLKIAIICNADGQAGQTLQVVAEQMRGVGIDVEQRCVEKGTQTALAKAGDFDINMQPMGGTTDDPDRRLQPYAHSKGSSNFGKLKDAKLDEMVERQGKILNADERQKLLHDIQRHMIDQALCVPTPDKYYYGMMQSYVRGYDPAYTGVAHPHPRSEAGEIWLDK